MIVSFLNQKGGVGKSTLSVNVAAYLAKKPRKVLLIDADTQGTVAAWAALREERKFQVVSMARDNMARDAMAMAVDYQDVIIDGPPGAGKITRAAIIASDVVLVPIELQAVAQGGVCGFAKTGEYGLGPRCPRNGRDERLPDSEK